MIVCGNMQHRESLLINKGLVLEVLVDRNL